MSLKALIFDLDGTLINSAPDLRGAVNKLLKGCNRREISLEETMEFVGNGAAKLVERAFRATGDALLETEITPHTERFLAFYDGHECDETYLYDNVMGTLKNLQDKGYKLALCTNKPRQPTLNIVRHFALEGFFEFILGGDELANKKPNPQMLHYLLDRMKLSSYEAVMIGDSANDIGAAQNATMKSIAVSYGYRKMPVEKLGADYIVDDFMELSDIVANW